MKDTLDPADGAALAASIRSGATTAVAALEAALARADEAKAHGAISNLDAELGPPQAAALDKGNKGPPKLQ